MSTSAERAKAELDALALVNAWRHRDDLGPLPLAELIVEYLPPSSPAVPLVLALVGQVSHTSEALCRELGFDVDEFFQRLALERAARVAPDDPS